ncbi:MAG: O-antigen ligase family protein [Vicinamibacterales bacterium]
MSAIALCVAAFAAAFLAGRRSMWLGLAAVLSAGYAYGIVRANLGGATHLLFDAAVGGFLAAQLWTVMVTPDRRNGAYGLRCWTLVLIAWPTLLFFFAEGDILVELVGWRANVFLLPFLLVGAQLDDDSVYRVAIVMAVLNIGAAILGALEFTLGLQMFFPYNEVTDLLYKSRLSDQESLGLRIPSSFVNAHAYGGTMVMTLPFIVGAWIQQRERWHSHLLTGAIVASLLGVFMAGARTPMIVLGALVVLVTMFGRLRGYAWVTWAGVIAVVGWVISGDLRLQRFVSLQDTQGLSERWSGSVNHQFVELMGAYPFGRGLAGGGTSIPYFLKDRFETNFVMENEFARIVMEQGVPGLFLWVLFMAWVLTKVRVQTSDPWHLSRRLVLATAGSYFLFALTGIGLLTSVPQSMVLMLGVGWVAVRQPAAARQMAPERLRKAGLAVSA